jgi:glutamine synthetase
MFKKLSLLILCSMSLLLRGESASGSAVVDVLDNENVEYVHFVFTDILGNTKSITVPIMHVEDAFENNLLFDGSSVPGCGKISDSDMMLKPDSTTVIVAPAIDGAKKTAEIICDMYVDDATPFAGCARSILKQALDELHALGYEFLVGPELEFFVLVEDAKGGTPSPLDVKKYCDKDTDLNVEQFKCNLLSYLQAHGINVEKIHHEVAPGQLEISIRYTNALEMADTLVRAKNMIKMFARNAGLRVSFMPKPFYGQNGSGMHVHFSLFDTQKNTNAFYDAQDKYNLSPVAKQFIAGILNRIRSMSLILNQTTNSYKRLVPGYEAPTRICWGAKNRSALIRIPQIKTGVGAAARAEIRCPDALANPYLLFAALIKAGLAGIKNNEQAPQAADDNLYHVSEQELKSRGIGSIAQSLREAIDLFAAGEVAQELFSPCVLAEFLKLKNEECNESCRVVTDWELKRYL